jgi:uncharacterized protein YyaL (SSP411 family)
MATRNRLAQETSPYLQQHASNPVDWYPWGPEALERARGENMPILLSIGYAACHWCHVMAHESFEDPETATLMNERFVCIKVDREERPDLDGIYMQAVQAMTGRGGWPMTMFLTPAGLPYYGGTYFPPADRPGMPSFKRVLTAASDAFRARPDDVARAADTVRELYASAMAETRSAGGLTQDIFTRAFAALSDDYDARHGGFGGAPKFPQAMALAFLLRHSARAGSEVAQRMALDSFLAMARGGMYDQIGGGFARYAVDERWLVPHFEKMLYDNALLATLGVHLWQATGDPEVERVTRETLDWLARELRSDDGAFCASYDADSEGHEGRFYVWSMQEFTEALGGEAEIAAAYWGVTEAGNFEGANILHVAESPRAIAARLRTDEARVLAAIARARHVLRERRATRVWPARDDKVLASWNALAVRAFALASLAFDDAGYGQVALEAGAFLFDRMVAGGRAMRSFNAGQTRQPGFLEDHAGLGLATLSLYELTFDPVWLTHARSLASATVTWFWNDEAGAFFDTAADQETLITRPRELTDNATPSGTSLAVELLTRLAELLQDVDARRRATYVAETLQPMVARYPAAFGHLLLAMDMLVYGAVELAVVGDPTSAEVHALRRAAASRFIPGLVLAGGTPSETTDVALLAGRDALDGGATAYLCRGYTCEAPVTAPDDLARQIDALTNTHRAPSQIP